MAPTDGKRTHTLEVAGRAFERFKEGLATGRFEAFLEMTTEDFTFFFPTGKWHGPHQGREKAREFFAYVASIFPGGIRVLAVDRVMANDTTAIFELRDEGRIVLPGGARDYKNRVAVSFDVRGERISAYREYFGSDGQSY